MRLVVQPFGRGGKAFANAFSKRFANRLGAPFLAMLVLSGCAQMQEAEARAVLERWFWLGENSYFNSTRDCTAAVYELRGGEVKSTLNPEARVSAALAGLERRGVMALSHPEGTPDEAFVEVMNQDRPVGVALQEAVFSARACMDEAAEGVFHQLLSSPGALLVFDREAGIAAVMDGEARLVVLAGGAGG